MGNPVYQLNKKYFSNLSKLLSPIAPNADKKTLIWFILNLDCEGEGGGRVNQEKKFLAFKLLL